MKKTTPKPRRCQHNHHLSTQDPRREQLLAGWARRNDHPPLTCELLARRVDCEDNGTTGTKRRGRTMQ